MSDEYTCYERGLQRLLEYLVNDYPRYIDVSLLQSRLVMSVERLRKYGSNNSGERAYLLEVFEQLHRICAEVVEMNFNKWCTLVFNEDRERILSERDPMQPYIGDWQALQNGSMQQVLMDELIELEIKLNTGRSIPIEDPLERFKAVPLHARFLYTSQDQAIATYIVEHWGAIDSLSKDICDIYQSVAQFNSAEDASDYIDYITHSRMFKKAHLPVYTQLPGIFFYDHNEDAEFISFGPHADAIEITRILRRIFEKLYSKPDIAAVRQAKKLVYQTRKS